MKVVFFFMNCPCGAFSPYMHMSNVLFETPFVRSKRLADSLFHDVARTGCSSTNVRALVCCRDQHSIAKSNIVWPSSSRLIRSSRGNFFKFHMIANDVNTVQGGRCHE